MIAHLVWRQGLAVGCVKVSRPRFGWRNQRFTRLRFFEFGICFRLDVGRLCLCSTRLKVCFAFASRETGDVTDDSSDKCHHEYRRTSLLDSVH